MIRRRGSTRRFARAPITHEQLATMLDRATRGIAADCLHSAGGPLADLFLIVNAVEGLAPGAFVLDHEQQALELLKGGTFRDLAGRLALGQNLGADAAANVYVLVDLAPLLARFGNRGYRVAQLEAAITAGKLYLAARTRSGSAQPASRSSTITSPGSSPRMPRARACCSCWRSAGRSRPADGDPAA